TRSPWYSLPDHLCRFRVRAATALARGFSRQHGITLLRLNRLRITSHPRAQSADMRICLHVGLQACTRTTTAWRDYPPASPHRLPTTGSGPTLPQQTHPKAGKRVRMVSITGLDTGALPRAREYQPVVHRLRLSASP